MRSHVRKKKKWREKHLLQREKPMHSPRRGIEFDETEGSEGGGQDTRWKEEVGWNMNSVGKVIGATLSRQGKGRQQWTEGAWWGTCSFSESKDYGGLDLAGDEQVNQGYILKDQTWSQDQSLVVIPPLAEAHSSKTMVKRGAQPTPSLSLPSPQGVSFPAHLLVEALQKDQWLVSLCSMVFCYISLHFMGKILCTAQ